MIAGALLGLAATVILFIFKSHPLKYDPSAAFADAPAPAPTQKSETTQKIVKDEKASLPGEGDKTSLLSKNDDKTSLLSGNDDKTSVLKNTNNNQNPDDKTTLLKEEEKTPEENKDPDEERPTELLFPKDSLNKAGQGSYRASGDTQLLFPDGNGSAVKEKAKSPEKGPESEFDADEATQMIRH